MTKQEIINITNTYLIEKLGFDESIVTQEADIRRDLGMTSLDAIDIVLFIRRTWGIQPQIPDIQAIVTLQDLYDYIEQYQASI